jgi:diaminopimelate epimerase
VSALCRRGTGIGADGLILLERSAQGIKMTHWNSDGLRNDYCGNGTRCAARLAFERGLTGRSFVLETDAGRLAAEVLPDGSVRTEAPAFSGDPVPVDVPLPAEPRAPRAGHLVTCGVPHLVVEVDDPAAVDVEMLGAKLRRHPALGPSGANVDFVREGKDGTLDIRTFERGIEGETLACGSGALAAAAWAWGRRGGRKPVLLRTRSGATLRVSADNGPAGPRVWLEGEARIVFRGTAPIAP